MLLSCLSHMCFFPLFLYTPLPLSSGIWIGVFILPLFLPLYLALILPYSNSCFTLVLLVVLLVVALDLCPSYLGPSCLRVHPSWLYVQESLPFFVWYFQDFPNIRVNFLTIPSVSSLISCFSCQLMLKDVSISSHVLSLFCIESS